MPRAQPENVQQTSAVYPRMVGLSTSRGLPLLYAEGVGLTATRRDETLVGSPVKA